MSHSMSRIHRLLDRYEVTRGRRFVLADVNPDDTGGLESKDDAAKWLARDLERLHDLQDKLYARGTWSVLLIFQAMDAAGKDSTIAHVMSGVNPQGCQVHSFKAPSDEELRHDFLWRTTLRLPERGHIGIFNRSYYEEVLVVRVHRELLEKQRIPSTLVTKSIWDERMDAIRAYERHLQRSGTLILKFFLHVSKDEQRKRFLERLEKPDKYWKFSARDVAERQHWSDYMRAYEDAIRHTASRHAPWYVVPADHKWFTRLIVASAIVRAIGALDLDLAPLTRADKRAIKSARAGLLHSRSRAAVG
jgi:PPK2 family polyphosphate:nucleotide phosphotransferase